MAAPLTEQLDKIVAKYAARPDTSEVRFAVSAPQRGFDWHWDSPGQHEPYFIASTTKLYATAMILQLRAEGKLDLDRPAAQYLPPHTMDRLHVMGGIDYGNAITVRQLMAHTSGLADFFEQKRADGTTVFGELLKQDRELPLAEVLRITREEMQPHFPPGTPGSAYYSDTNYQLLGAIIQHVDGEPWVPILRRRITEPLGLADTWSFAMDTLGRYDEIAPMLNGSERVVIPKAMASFPADGGMVSTTADQIVFLRAFMTGGLFPRAYLDEIARDWLKVFAPLQYGTGIMLFELPRYYTLGQKVPRFIGHSGASGAVLFYAPQLDLYVAGAVNQVQKRSLPYNVMVRLAMTVQRAWK